MGSGPVLLILRNNVALLISREVVQNPFRYHSEYFINIVKVLL